jgi:hypothetical protein
MRPASLAHHCEALLLALHFIRIAAENFAARVIDRRIDRIAEPIGRRLRIGCSDCGLQDG